MENITQEKPKKKTGKKKYKPILDGIRHWPVYQLSKNKKEFLDDVVKRSLQEIYDKHPQTKDVLSEIETTVYREQNRIKRNRWRADPKDDAYYWQGVKEELIKISSANGESEKLIHALLEKIVRRYVEEIAGNFKPSSYRFAREVVKFWFNRLLNGARIKKFGAFFRRQYTLSDKIQIVGKTKLIRKLARKGTVVMVPTHSSNIDSILVGWIIHELGLPAFIYGAGLNLFNIKIFAYFMNSLGAYKVDRRKKNFLYLETLKSYSMCALMKGAHSLFFPGGTRSRSGAIEKMLKRGLLGSTVEAQRNLFLEQAENTTEVGKIFIVPVTLNTHFVLEAPDLIEEYLHTKGQDHYFPEADKYGSFQLIRFLFKFFTKGSNISVSIGRGMDVLGNYVDEEGNSLDAHHRPIDIRDYFVSDGMVVKDTQRESEYCRMLSQRIVEEYYKIHRVFSSHLVAYIAFELWVRKYPMLDLFGLLRMPEEELEIEYTEFREVFDKLRKVLKKMKKEGKVKIDMGLKGDLDTVIQQGIENVGIFHLNRPVLKNKKGNIITKDLSLLYYYHNRLTGYDLERHF